MGLLLCKGKDRLIVEYALRDFRKPIGVADWKTKIVTRLPKELQGSLPTIREIEMALAGASKPGHETGKKSLRIKLNRKQIGHI
ncbi:MAG: DUF1016 family protein [Deltaproteobacteria bacterium]|nr:DUF1016 family protein [Deltaproteobacteria bacterium]